MKLFSFFKIRKKEQCNILDLPNPYVNKYNIKEIGLDNVVYLLYCDYADATKWIKDVRRPDVYFSNYDKAIQILELLIAYQRMYTFKNFSPDKQLLELNENYEEYTKRFLLNYWNSTLDSAAKLKTGSGKERRIQSFFENIYNYNSRLTPVLSQFIETLKSGTDAKVIVEPVSIKFRKQNLNTLSDIDKISAKDESAIRELQKAATEFKRNNQMDLAIACLRKSNELSDYCGGILSTKEYLRLIKYIRYTGNLKLASDEEAKIYERHPEFKDKRISNLHGIQENLKKNKEWGNDLVVINTSSTCSICKKYNRKIYSISGESKMYPKLPIEVTEQGGFCPDCYLGLNSYFEDTSTPSIK